MPRKFTFQQPRIRPRTLNPDWLKIRGSCKKIEFQNSPFEGVRNHLRATKVLSNFAQGKSRDFLAKTVFLDLSC